jgi:transposase
MSLYTEEVHEKGIFLTFFGDTPLLRVLDFFMVNEVFDYSMVQIARQAGVGYSTLKLMWPHLIETGVLVQTRTIGKAKLFTINKESEITKKFKKFYWTLTRLISDKLLEEEYGTEAIARLNAIKH